MDGTCGGAVQVGGEDDIGAGFAPFACVEDAVVFVSKLLLILVKGKTGTNKYINNYTSSGLPFNTLGCRSFMSPTLSS